MIFFNTFFSKKATIPFLCSPLFCVQYVKVEKERKRERENGKIKKHNGVKYDGLASGDHKFLVTNVSSLRLSIFLFFIVPLLQCLCFKSLMFLFQFVL